MSPGRRSILQLACLPAWLSVWPSPGRSATIDRGPLHVLLGPDSERQRAIVEALRERFTRVLASQDVATLLAADRPLAYVAVGPAALQAATAARLTAPLISTFASRESFARAMAQSAAGIRATAIHAEPSPAQQMRLIAGLYRRTVTVGALISEQSAFMVPLLQQAAQDQGLELMVARSDTSLTLSRNLLKLASARVLLIFPDSSLYTTASLRELLESTYRRRQPVIGFSEALVNAGTLASAHSDISDTLAHLQAVVGSIADGRLPEPQYPKYWRVAINDNVARSLDVVIDDAARRMGDRP